MRVKPALGMDHRFDVLFTIDDDNHQTEIAYDPSITAEDLQGDSEEEYTQTILSIVNHFAMLPVMDPSRVEARFDLGTDPTDLMYKTGRYWKSDIEFGLKARTEPELASETLGPASTDKSREI